MTKKKDPHLCMEVVSSKYSSLDQREVSQLEHTVTARNKRVTKVLDRCYSYIV